MRRLAMVATTLLVAATVLAVVPAVGQPAPIARQGLVIEPQTGFDIYTHTTATDYRTSPALMKFSGDTLYQYTCGPAPTGPGEVIRTAVTYNNGSTWSGETLRLQPTPDSPDALGVCDPSIAKVDNYYYLTYTGLASNGTRQIFAARGTSVAGPFTKWNGTTWTGGTPTPLATWTSQAAGPSLINRAGTLYLYYNTRITTGPAAGTYQTRLATAPLGTTTGEHQTWPTRLQPDPGTAINHPGKYTGYDCVGTHWWADTDVKYDEATNKFLALTTDQVTYPWSALQAYESTGGHTFTKTTITRGDYQAGARAPGQLSDPYGHITPNALRATAYAHSTTCGQADLRYTLTTHHTLTTGSVAEPLSTSAANWHPDSGTWRISPEGYYEETQSVESATYESSLTGRALSASSVIAVAVRTGDDSAAAVGVHFGKVHPDDTVDESGYFASVTANGAVCLDKAGFGQMACAATLLQPWVEWVQLRIVQANGVIKVYLNGHPDLGIAVTDADHPYLGGYVGLVTKNSWGRFANLNAWDNVPGPEQASDDWRVTSGAWGGADGQMISLQLAGQCVMVDSTGLTSDVETQLGDGTYAATVRVGNPGAPLSWAGLALTDNGATGSWSDDGYLVFLRGNGSVGIYKAGVGQVVADVPTGTDPMTRGVRIRVLKTHANFQVYVDNAPEPVVNWTDTQAPSWSVGTFGLANLGSAASFVDITYNGNEAR